MSSDAEPTKPRFTQPLQDREVLEGNRARLDCVIVAHPEPEVRHSRIYYSEKITPEMIVHDSNIL